MNKNYIFILKRYVLQTLGTPFYVHSMAQIGSNHSLLSERSSVFGYFPSICNHSFEIGNYVGSKLRMWLQNLKRMNGEEVSRGKWCLLVYQALIYLKVIMIRARIILSYANHWIIFSNRTPAIYSVVMKCDEACAVYLMFSKDFGHSALYSKLPFDVNSPKNGQPSGSSVLH